MLYNEDINLQNYLIREYDFIKVKTQSIFFLERSKLTFFFFFTIIPIYIHIYITEVPYLDSLSLKPLLLKNEKYNFVLMACN